MKPANTPTVVLLGLGDNGKPRAARFDAAQVEVARKAAKAMGLRVGHPKTDEAKALAAKLALGKLFATGKGLVPLVKADLHKQLMDKLELEPVAAPAKPGPGTPAAQPATAQPAAKGAQGAAKAADTPAANPADLWAAIKVGSTVIAPEKHPEEDGWWRATVTAVSKDGRTITIRWLDAPKQPPVTLKRQAVGLLYPA